MSFLDKLKHAFQPIAHEVQSFNPQHAADAIRDAIANPVRRRIPGHLSLHEVEQVVKIARPDAIDVDLFVGFGVEIGVELEMEFDLGVTWEQPDKVIAGIVGLVENPPETVHQLLDRLWAIVPAEVRVYERMQAVVGEQCQIRWYGEDVMQRVVNYIGSRGWLEKKLRP